MENSIDYSARARDSSFILFVQVAFKKRKRTDIRRKCFQYRFIELLVDTTILITRRYGSVSVK